MDQLTQFIGRARAITYVLIVLSNCLLLGVGFVLYDVFRLAPHIAFGVAALLALVLPLTIIWGISSLFTKPLARVWQAVLYLAPTSSGIAAPKMEHLGLGQTVTTNMVRQIYQLAHAALDQPAQAEINLQQAAGLLNTFVGDSLPLPLLICGPDNDVVYGNTAFMQWSAAETPVGKKIYDALPLSFNANEQTLEQWLADSQEHKATSTRIWQRVRAGSPTDTRAPLIDLIAYYNKENTAGYETMYVVYDRTAQYGKEDTALDFISMAVHELRTPLTMLRGYIEALEEELEGKIAPELYGYMQKMRSSAEQLATFVNNILHVARIEDGQMFLHLGEEHWQELLPSIVNDLSLRAQLRGITIKTEIEGNLPTVAVDRVSIYQVMSNLIDNAIKYSKDAKEIIIRTHVTTEGLVETSVQDFGIGIPESSLGHLFEKFYRDHHTRANVTGTGLGLFLCKTFIDGHGGTLWVHSKEGQGSTFGFTLQPYANLAAELEKGDNKGITRSAHGWIKNHSFYSE